MSKRFGPNVSISKTADGFAMHYAKVPGQPDLPAVSLHPLNALILSYLDRGWRTNRLCDHLTTKLAPVTTRESLEEIVKKVLLHFKRHFTHHNQGSTISLGDEDALLEDLAQRKTPYTMREVVFPDDRSPFPLTLQWLVTRYCNRQCIYCYQSAIPSKNAKDAALPMARVKELLGEGTRLGVRYLFLTGGEPLLRDDIYDIIVYALEDGYDVDFLTKQFVPEREVQRMAKAGLKAVTVSIDSLEDEAAWKMTGIGNFARKIRPTVQHFVKYGIKVNITAVITPLNLHSIPETLMELDQMGVYSIALDAYMPNLGRHSDSYELDSRQKGQLKAWIDDFKSSKESDVVVRFISEIKENKNTLNKDGFVCHNGATSLLFTPDGQVSRCDKKFPDRDFLVGDLRHQSIHDVWHSQALIETLKPSRDQFKGTECYDCEHFDTCNERNRCFYNAYVENQKLHSPQGIACLRRTNAMAPMAV